MALANVRQARLTATADASTRTLMRATAVLAATPARQGLVAWTAPACARQARSCARIRILDLPASNAAVAWSAPMIECVAPADAAPQERLAAILLRAHAPHRAHSAVPSDSVEASQREVGRGLTSLRPSLTHTTWIRFLARACSWRWNTSGLCTLL